MIDTIKALDWLNAIDQSSRLSDEARRLLADAYRFPVSDVRVSLILERLRNMGRATRDPLEKAEILLSCASLDCYRPSSSPPAARDAREAVSLYDCDDHRRAVALWILGIIQWDLVQNYEAYKSWSEAKELFRQCRVLYQNFPDDANWYGNRMWEMDVELVARPEEIATWLNRFEASSLRPPTQWVVDRVRAKSRKPAYSNVQSLMQDLREANNSSDGLYETAELHLEFGLAIYQLRNIDSAIEFLRHAVRNFHPGFGTYHKQVVARCLLGAIEWMQESTQQQAAAHWMHGLDELERLRWWADRDNCREKEEWYARRSDLLRAALLERVRPPNPVGNSDSAPGQSRPGTPPPAPDPGKTDLYQELLARAGWDPCIADRLIEYERKLAPTADRNELIRRAIERLIRDNQ
ncbi:MAG TPA: hypothetical protein VGK56_18990 [Anaerolineales bacterium]